MGQGGQPLGDRPEPIEPQCVHGQAAARRHDLNAVAAEDGEDRHQQHPPLGKANPAAHAAIRKRLEEADQIGFNGWAVGLGGQG